MIKFAKLSVVVLVCVAVILGCSKKEDPAPSLIGSWKLVSETTTNCTDPGDNGTYPCTDCYILSFTATTFTFSYGGTSIGGTYSTSGNNLTMTLTGGPPTTGTYTLNATTLSTVFTHIGSGCTVTTSYSRQ
ncbi:MAG: lipocalin family protein [Cyclobacteriaceae bacterium]|nr:lipocalin family protein [Cyclobacteriaceae bacterium]